MDFIPPAFVQRIGDDRFPRFVFRDTAGRFFTGTDWSDNPIAAAIYHRESDAIAAQMRYSDGKHVRDVYTATIVVTTDKDAWPYDELLWLLKMSQRIVETGLDDVSVELIWEDLKKVEP